VVVLTLEAYLPGIGLQEPLRQTIALLRLRDGTPLPSDLSNQIGFDHLAGHRAFWGSNSDVFQFPGLAYLPLAGLSISRSLSLLGPAGHRGSVWIHSGSFQPSPNGLSWVREIAAPFANAP
jgi:hypothetical protein